MKYKFDIHGVGHDQAEQHKFKWWERAFETAAAAIEVGDGNFVFLIWLFIVIFRQQNSTNG